MRDESLSDFEAIARRVRRIDPSIRVLLCPNSIDSSMIPKGFLDLPLLAIYLCSPPPDSFKPTAGQLAVKSFNKIEQYEHFKKHNIPSLPIEEFTWGMTLDPSIYSEWVALKPQTKQSTGKDINMIPTRLIPTLTLEDFPKEHLIHQDKYYVQKFLKTGERAEHYRVTIFLNYIIFSTKSISIQTYPSEDSSLDVLLKNSIASNVTTKRTTSLFKDPEVNAFALKVAATYPLQPLFGIDILRCAKTQKLYVLETNSGGNVWHFSSAIARKLPGYDDKARKNLILQYHAWDRAAEALVRKTHALSC